MSQSYGLQFASRDADPEKRTSLDLTPNESIFSAQNIALSFDMAFLPNNQTYFGYVFRIINDKKQNLDLLYDEIKQGFKVIFGDSYTDINISIPRVELLTHWVKFNIEIDNNKGVSLYCNGRLIKSNLLAFKGNCLKICFGACNYPDFKSSDVVPMKIRNIGLNINNGPKYFWPLNESSGTTIKDSIAHKNAVVTNGYWLKPRHSNWALLKRLAIKGIPGVAFDAATEQLYITAADSLYTFSAKTATLAATPLKTRHEHLLVGNQSIFNPFNGHLYNFYIDQHLVTEYNFSKHQWDRNFAATGLTDYYQVNKFFSMADSSLYILGGYGHLKYKNTVQRYNLANGNWEIIKTGGDYFSPRYLAGAGTTPNGDTAYILGGYGSKDGDQLLNPKYYYDLLQYNVSSRSFKKLFTLKEPAAPFVVANSLVIDSTRKYYYALIYPKDQLDAKLQLIKGSLEQPDYELIGSSFPYTFFDIQSFADLYYCSTTKLFLAATLYTNKDSVTEVKISSINFPPNRSEAGESIIATKQGTRFFYFFAAGVMVLALIAGFLYRSRKNRVRRFEQEKQLTREAATAIAEAAPLVMERESEHIIPEPEIPQTARIYLFGNFEVIASSGENITGLFTPLLKELFLLLCIHSIRYGKGVSPEKLIETLWHNKETKDAINNRSVNIAKLKSILSKIEGCSLPKESGYWKLEYDPSTLYIDFDKYIHIFSEGAIDNRKGNELLSITQRGSFLPQTSYEWGDNIKSEINNFIVDALLKYCRQLSFPEHAEKIILICNAIFFYDELNENALGLKCKSLIALGRHTLAKQAFENFVVKYKEIYGEDYNVSYHSLITN
jgi:two-component SAPR family response regulator